MAVVRLGDAGFVCRRGGRRFSGALGRNQPRLWDC
ncbi:hypothetical protein GZL_00251 [Streptomyces sp. 769]|nr:hypothetical protein GZL_00251 [Streptomyces sp. 769]